MSSLPNRREELQKQNTQDGPKTPKTDSMPSTPRRSKRKGDGTFSFSEFVDIVCIMGGGEDRPCEQEQRELRDAFRIFDKRGRGYICASDLRAVLQCLGEDMSEEEIDDMIREADIDGDGRVDFEEFVKALTENDDSDDEDPKEEEGEEEQKK